MVVQLKSKSVAFCIIVAGVCIFGTTLPGMAIEIDGPKFVDGLNVTANEVAPFSGNEAASEVHFDGQVDQPVELAQRKRKRRKFKAVEPTNADPAEQVSQQAQDAVDRVVPEDVASMINWLPDWGAPQFDWNLGPIIGLRYSDVSTEAGRVRTVGSEFGLASGISGLPLKPGNPGLYVGVGGGYAVGRIKNVKVSGINIESEDLQYSRLYGHNSYVIPFKFYRHTFTLGGGRRDYKNIDDVRTFSIENDFAVRVLSWMSAHYTLTNLTIFSDSYKEPNVKERDSWLHARMNLPLGISLLAGPGLTYTQIFAKDAAGKHLEIAKGQTDYFKASLTAPGFWLFKISGYAQYVYRSTDDILGTYASQELPSKGLHEPRTVTMPSDSLVANAFIGIPNLLGGFGFGWVYNAQMLNLKEKDGAKKEITRDHGFQMIYSGSW